VGVGDHPTTYQYYNNCTEHNRPPLLQPPVSGIDYRTDFINAIPFDAVIAVKVTHTNSKRR